MPIRTLQGDLVPDPLGPAVSRCSVRWLDSKRLLCECPNPNHSKIHGVWKRDDQGFVRIALHRP